jgi:hypothetical protein
METNSYVAFFRMDACATLLLRDRKKTREKI